MTQVTDTQTARYDTSSIKVLGPLEPVRRRPPMFIGCANPVLHCEDSVEALRAILAFEETLLLSFRHYKVQLAVMMRRLRRYSRSWAWRADMVLRAIRSLSSKTALIGSEVLYKCRRYLMLTAQHDDARQCCPAAGLARL